MGKLDVNSGDAVGGCWNVGDGWSLHTRRPISLVILGADGNA